ncbi:MAG: metal ABC transporter permease, partial [Chlamydiia bacterium]|nr:metal ABC transporter permease [Chlamydiia bacterium]
MAWASPLLYFTDPILRAPTLGCMLMGLAAALVGVIVLLRRQSLLGESLAHASYPGVIIGILLAASFVPDVQDDGWLSIVILGGAFCSALLGLWCIEWLQRSMR